MNQKQEEIAERILDYFYKNPDAKGTLDDIVQWWLSLERIDQTVGKVAEVIEKLLERGLIKKVTRDDGTLMFQAIKM